MNIPRRRFSQITSCAMIAGALPRAFAQAGYPIRPVRMIVAFPAGAPTDQMARAVAQGLSARLGQPVLVENRPGASGAIGTEHAARAASDGYTLLFGTVDTQVVLPLVNARLPFDPSRQFEPVVAVAKVPGVLVARSDFPGSSAADLLRLAREKPGTVSFASWGIGSVAHVAMAMLEISGGIELLHVPFLGVAPALTQLLGKQVDLMFLPVPYALAQEKAGKVKIFGAGTRSRPVIAPQMRTLDEQGFTGFHSDTWFALFAPTGVSTAVRERLNREVNAVLAMPEVQAPLREMGADPILGGSIDDLDSLVRSEKQRWGRVVREKRIEVQLQS
jgi:tripartite-type tricarboxylate transporter receptor subunit TctC